MLEARDGVSFRAGYWPAPSTPRSVCLLLPGLGDFLEKRAPVAERVAASGHTVVSLDWRGQGASARLGRDPRAAHVRRFEDYANDAEQALRAFVPTALPIWIVGYSMGGTIAVPLARRLDARGLALVSPMLRLPGVPEGMVSALAWLVSRIGLGERFAPGEAERSPMGSVRGEVSDPDQLVWLHGLQRDHVSLTITGTSWGWAGAAIAAMRWARIATTSVQSRACLIALASGERSVDPRAIRAAAGAMDARLVELEGAHDLFLARAATRERLLGELIAMGDRAAGSLVAASDADPTLDVTGRHDGTTALHS